MRWLSFFTIMLLTVSGLGATDALRPRGARVADGRDDITSTSYLDVVTSANLATRFLPVGTNGYVWTVSGGLAQWMPAVGGSSGHAQNTDIGTDAVDWTLGLYEDSYVSNLRVYFGGAWAGSALDIPFIGYSNDHSGDGRFETNRDFYTSGQWLGDGSLLEDVNAETLEGQAGSYYRNSSNQNAGNLPITRMPTGGKWDVTSTVSLFGVARSGTSTTGTFLVLVPPLVNQESDPEEGGPFAMDDVLQTLDPLTSRVLFRIKSDGGLILRDLVTPGLSDATFSAARLTMDKDATIILGLYSVEDWQGLGAGSAGVISGKYVLAKDDIHALDNIYASRNVIVGPGRQEQAAGATGSLYIESAGTAGVPTNGTQIMRLRTDTTGARFNNHLGWTGKEGSVSQYFWFDDRIISPEIQTTGTAYVQALVTTGTATFNGNTVLGDASGDAVTIGASTVTASNIPTGLPTVFLGRNASNQLVKFTTATALILPDNVAYVNAANGWTSLQTLPGVTVQGDLTMTTGVVYTTAVVAPSLGSGTGVLSVTPDEVHFPNAAIITFDSIPNDIPTALLGMNGAQEVVGFNTIPGQLLPNTVPNLSSATNGWTAAQTIPGVTVAGNLSVSTGTTTLAAVAINGGATISKRLRATASLSFDFSGNQSDSNNVTVTGAAVGDTVFLGIPNDSDMVEPHLFTGFVSAVNTVTIWGFDVGAAGDEISGTFTVDVW